MLVVTLGNQPHIECFLRRLYSTSLYIIAFTVQVLSLDKSESTLMLGQTDRQHQPRPQTQSTVEHSCYQAIPFYHCQHNVRTLSRNIQHSYYSTSAASWKHRCHAELAVETADEDVMVDAIKDCRKVEANQHSSLLLVSGRVRTPARCM